MRKYEAGIDAQQRAIEVYNLTPHKVSILDKNNKVVHEIESDGTIRASQSDVYLGELAAGIPVYKTSYGEAYFVDKNGQESPMPEKKDGIVYIASIIACQALPDRDDLYIVNGLVRDAEGQIIGARGLSKNPYLSYYEFK